MQTFEGAIEDVLASGEYDCGDYVIVKYDELYDLVEQAKILTQVLVGHSFKWQQAVTDTERRTNRPLHPCLGGKSPYSEFLPL